MTVPTLDTLLTKISLESLAEKVSRMIRGDEQPNDCDVAKSTTST
jgi:hypothetical protein